MSEQTAPGIDLHVMLGSFWVGIEPMLPYLVPLFMGLLVLTTPLPGRGPTSRRRDPWRMFKFDARRTVLARAGHRCEAAALLFFGRCRDQATEADHVYPWSRGGATVVSNGQALCRGHNRSKSNVTPAWWYLLLLERRRRGYFPAGVDLRVRGGMSAADQEAREAWSQRRRPR